MNLNNATMIEKKLWKSVYMTKYMFPFYMTRTPNTHATESIYQ